MAATRVIELRTEISAPRARVILERERHAVARPLIVHAPIAAAEARGPTSTDVDGNTFVDFVGGVGGALGAARGDDGLLAKADERFHALGLEWHRSQTERLLAGI